MPMNQWMTFACGAGAVLIGVVTAIFISPPFLMLTIPGFGFILLASCGTYD